MVGMSNIDAGKKADWDKGGGLGFIAFPLILAGAAAWKRQEVITVIKYRDSTSQEQVVAINFLGNVNSAQPFIHTKFLVAQVKRNGLHGYPNNDTHVLQSQKPINNASLSIADE
jgi:hypothetical protein